MELIFNIFLCHDLLYQEIKIITFLDRDVRLFVAQSEASASQKIYSFAKPNFFRCDLFGVMCCIEFLLSPVLPHLEIKRLPSPNGERFGYRQSTTNEEKSVTFESQRKNKRAEIVVDPPPQRSYRRQNVFVDDHPFITNGNFTPNPSNVSRNELHEGRHVEGARHGYSSFNDRRFHKETRKNEERSFTDGHRPQNLPLRRDSSYNDRRARAASENGSISSRESSKIESSQDADRSVAASEKSMPDKKVQEQHEKQRKQKVREKLAQISIRLKSFNSWV